MKIHFIGIGGIGVSALAKYYLSKGHKISGSDLCSSEITEALKELGAEIYIGKNTINKNADLTIYSPAFKIDEFKKENKNSSLPKSIKSYPEALGELTKNHYTIAVSGTHGKSTTSSMLGLLLTKAGLDPTVIIGTKLKEFNNSNCRVGKSKYLVIEADEHFASFLNYRPQIIVLTNIEADHLDYYKNLNNILRAFKKYVSFLPKEGVLVANKEDKNISKIKKQTSKLEFKTQDYSKKEPIAEKLKNILKIPGEHNVYNALAALKVARILDIPDKTSLKALAEYQGSWRRFEKKELKIKKKKLTVISDYGHHPTEVKATLKAVREKYQKNKIWCVYQPHQYQRTYYLFADFVKTFKQAKIDKIIITDIFEVAGREEDNIKKKISSEKMANAIKKENVSYLPQKEILNHLKENLSHFEVLVIMGAGDIYKIANLFPFNHPCGKISPDRVDKN